MKHTITFHTPDDQVKEIHDIRVTFLDQDDNAYFINAKASTKVEEVNNINWKIAARIKELNEGKI